jgi:hypothetical protein
MDSIETSRQTIALITLGDVVGSVCMRVGDRYPAIVKINDKYHYVDFKNRPDATEPLHFEIKGEVPADVLEMCIRRGQMKEGELDLAFSNE